MAIIRIHGIVLCALDLFRIGLTTVEIMLVDSAAVNIASFVSALGLPHFA